MSLEQLRDNLSRKRRRAPSWGALTAKYTDAPQVAAPPAAAPPKPVKAKQKAKEATEEIVTKKPKEVQTQAKKAAKAAKAEQADADADAETQAEAAGAAEEAHDGNDEQQDEEEEEEDEVVDELRWRSAAYDAHFDVEWGPAELSQRLAALRPCKWELAGLGSARGQSSVEELPAAAPVETAEACLRACGVLPVLRESWRRVHGAAPLGEARPSQL